MAQHVWRALDTRTRTRRHRSLAFSPLSRGDKLELTAKAGLLRLRHATLEVTTAACTNLAHLRSNISSYAETKRRRNASENTRVRWNRNNSEVSLVGTGRWLGRSAEYPVLMSKFRVVHVPDSDVYFVLDHNSTLVESDGNVIFDSAGEARQVAERAVTGHYRHPTSGGPQSVVWRYTKADEEPVMGQQQHRFYLGCGNPRQVRYYTTMSGVHPNGHVVIQGGAWGTHERIKSNPRDVISGLDLVERLRSEMAHLRGRLLEDVSATLA